MKNKIMGTVIVLFVLLSPLISIGSSVCSSGDERVEVQTIGTHVMDVEKLIWDKTHDRWVNEIYADKDDVLRFKIKVTYHDTDGDGPSYKIKWITITDILPPSLTYEHNATIAESSVSLDGRTISWSNLTGVELFDGQSLEIEFDTLVLSNGVITNTIDVTAFETCPHVWRHSDATATVYVTTSPAFRSRDVDSDGNDETATDINRDLTDGYESYEDDDASSDVVVSIDGDDDDKVDYFIDITRNGKPDRYWDPDDDVLVDLDLKDVDGDNTEEWVYDSDDDGVLDRYYDPDDGKIHLYDVESPTVKIVKPMRHYLYKNDIRRRFSFRTIIIGPITIKANVSNTHDIDRVEFYVDGKLKYTDRREPYRWTWLFKPVELRKRHVIEVKAYDTLGRSGSDKIVVWRYRYHPLLDHPILTIGGTLLISKLLKGQPSEEEPPQPPGPKSMPNEKPVADAGGPYSGVVGEPVVFDGSASYDSDGMIVSYQWDFGDGKTGVGATSSHVYRNAGEYTVTLTVTDDGGKTAVDKAVVMVSKEFSVKQGEFEPFWYVVGGLSVTLMLALLALAFRRDVFE
ncbi:MAG TPA: PKD domain-containing protein [Thermoplasmatales archaeon]|nr:PKD domain-containing protein [Thermoplasmatales archaeon]